MLHNVYVNRAERKFYNKFVVKWDVSKPWHFEVNFTAAVLETDSALKVMSRRQKAYAVCPTVKSVCSILGVRSCCIRQVRIVPTVCTKNSVFYLRRLQRKVRDFRKLYVLQNDEENWRACGVGVSNSTAYISNASYTTYTVILLSWIRFLS